MTSQKRRDHTRRAAHASWENTPDRAARTAAARKAAAARFEQQARELHPDATDEDITRIAAELKAAFYERIQSASAQKRRAQAQAKRAERAAA